VKDNADVIKLVEDRPHGVIAILDSAWCARPRQPCDGAAAGPGMTTMRRALAQRSAHRHGRELHQQPV
jgi:hypothetical protein